MIRILLCSPIYKDKKNTTCGVANWTRNIMGGISRLETAQVDVLPYDRSVDLDADSSSWERLVSGVKDYLGIVWKTRRQIKEQKYDLIQVSTSASLGLIRDYLLIRIAKKRGVKIAFHFHFGRMPDILNSNNWESKLMRKILKNCDSAIVMDSSSYKSLKEHGYGHVYFLPNPISNDNLTYIDTQLNTFSRNKRQLLFVGHVVRNKGIYELVEACSQIENIKLKIIGKVFANTRKELEGIAIVKNNSKWIEFVGEVQHKDVLKEMSQCDIFVLPTYSEGFPNVILESMACGCPIIASDVGAIREMLDIDNNPCGVIIQPRKTSEVKNAILSLIEDEDRKKEYGILARKRLHNQYTTEVVCEKLRLIWNQILT